ncbi:MAG: DUF1501 domain-containing protein [Pirellulaceae bacterium]
MMFNLRAPIRAGSGHLNRREVLRVGGTGLLGLTLPQLLQAAAVPGASAPRSFGRARSCIVLFLLGGPPQQSTWDLKPDAPAEARGEIRPIATSLDGFQVGELMPRLARQADKLAILRAVSTGDNAHSSSGYYMMTGRPHAPQNRENANPGAPNDWPNLGAVVQRLTSSPGMLPAAVRLPMHIFNTDGSVWPGQDAGFLGRSCDPWLFRCEPHAPDFRIDEFTLPLDIPLGRLEGRASLLQQLNGQLAALERSDRLAHFTGLARRAYDVLSSAPARAAFRLGDEPAATRERYGQTPFGQSTLLARRLIEAGVRLVQVNWYRGPDEPSANPCWDSHTDETNRLRNVLVPPWDQAFAALLEDLDERGMLNETLVVCMAEFGRTPRMNARAGRDHWGPVFSVALAGGGIRRGVVHGASDKLAAYPRDGLVRPEDLLATVFHCLGHAPETEYHDPLGRPFIVSRGHVIEPILV